MALFLSEEDVGRLLSMYVALEAAEEALRLRAAGRATSGLPSRLPVGAGAFYFWAGAVPGLGVMGCRASVSRPGGPASSCLQLSSAENGELLAAIESVALERAGAAALTGVATRHLARRDASTLAILGHGQETLAHAEAVCRVRKVRHARVYSRSATARDWLASAVKGRLGIEATATASAQDCLSGADVAVLTSGPMVRGQWLQPGMHVNVVGAGHALPRHLDDAATGRVTAVVGDVEQARRQCQDLLHAVERGVIRWEQVRGLADVLVGAAPGREAEGDITLFLSGPLPAVDVATGARVYWLAREAGLGRELPF